MLVAGPLAVLGLASPPWLLATATGAFILLAMDPSTDLFRWPGFARDQQ